MKINHMLQCLLNSESQQKLMQLDISGFEGSFTPKWVGPITKMLPFLKHSIVGKSRNCKKFTESPILGYSKTRISKTDGIWKCCEMEELINSPVQLEMMCRKLMKEPTETSLPKNLQTTIRTLEWNTYRP